MDDRENTNPTPPEGQPPFNFLGMQMGVNIRDMEASVAEKLTPEHISMMIQASAEDDKNARIGERRQQTFTFLYILLGLAFVVFLVIFLKDNPDLMFRIITAVVSFIGGLGTGFTISKRKNGK